MRDLNYQLKQLCHYNRDGSYATQVKRMHHLMQIADQLYDLGLRGMKLRSAKQKQVDDPGQGLVASGISCWND